MNFDFFKEFSKALRLLKRFKDFYESVRDLWSDFPVSFVPNRSFLGSRTEIQLFVWGGGHG